MLISSYSCWSVPPRCYSLPRRARASSYPSVCSLWRWWRKLYPIFCCAVAVRSSRLATIRRRAAAISAASILSASPITYLLSVVTPLSSPYLSYGYLVPFLFVEQVVAPHLGFSGLRLSGGAAPTVAAAIWCAVIAGGSVALWRRGAQFCSLATGTAGTAFTFGAAIYCGSFLLMYINYAYRLDFPAALPAAALRVGRRASTEYTTHARRLGRLLVLLYFHLWCALVGDQIWLVISFCQYLIFAGLAGIVLLNGLRQLPSRLTRVRVKILIE